MCGGGACQHGAPPPQPPGTHQHSPCRTQMHTLLAAGGPGAGKTPAARRAPSSACMPPSGGGGCHPHSSHQLQPPAPGTPHTAPADTPAPSARDAEAGPKHGGFGCGKGLRRAAGGEPRWGRLGGKGGKEQRGCRPAQRPGGTAVCQANGAGGDGGRTTKPNRHNRPTKEHGDARGGGAKAHVVGGNQGGALIGP